MYDVVPTNITQGIRLSVLELSKTVRNDAQETNIPGCDKSKTSRSKKRKQIILPKVLVQSISEVVATSMLMCFGCMGCIATDSMDLPHHAPALAFGLVIMIIIQIFGPISGAHLNPSVTITAVMLGILKPLAGVAYIISQFAGGLLGFGLLKVIVPIEYTRNEHINPITNETVHDVGLCSTVLNPKVSIVQAFGLEVLLTATLALLCCSVWDKRNAHNSDSIPLRFGLAITAIGMIGGPMTGASMNPVRSFVPAVFNKDWDNHWIYWIGPTIGAIVGTVFYKSVFSPSDDDSIDNDDDNIEDIPLNEKINRI